jgi:hypothetical protein
MELTAAIETCKAMRAEIEGSDLAYREWSKQLDALDTLIQFAEDAEKMLEETAIIELLDGRKIIQIDEGAQSGRWKELLSPIPSVPTAIDAWKELKK